jgi:hypothetical protein
MSKKSRYSHTTSYVDSQGNVISHTDHEPYRDIEEHLVVGLGFSSAFPTLSKILGLAVTIVVFVWTFNENWGWFMAGLSAIVAGALAWAFGVYLLFLAAFLGVLYLLYLFIASTGGFGS